MKTAPPPKARRRQRTTIPRMPIEVVLAVAFATLYTTTRTHLNTFDAVSYANQVAHLYRDTGDPRWLFHPHHLLFNITGYAVTSVLTALGLQCDVLSVFEGINAIAAALGVAMMFRLLKNRLELAAALSLPVTLLVGLSYGYWVAATDGRVNMVSSVLLLAAFAQVAFAPVGRRSVIPILIGGVETALATLYHESAALFVPAACLSIALWPTPRFRTRIYRTAFFVLLWAALVAETYFGIGYGLLHLYSVAAFRRWSTEYAELGWWWDFHVARNLHLDVSALLRTVAVEPPRAADHGAMRRIFGTARSLTDALGCFCLLGAAWQRKQNRPFVAAALAWIAAEAAFFTVWSPGYFIFWIPVIFPLAALTACGFKAATDRFHASGHDSHPTPSSREGQELDTDSLSEKVESGDEQDLPSKTGRTVSSPSERLGGESAIKSTPGYFAIAALYVACAVIGIENARASIEPHMRPDCSPYQRIALDIRGHTQRGDIVIVDGIGDLAECEVNIPYFADRDVISLHTEFTRHHDDAMATTRDVQAQMRETLRQRHHVFMLDEAHDPAFASRRLIAKHASATAPVLKAMFVPWTKTVAWHSQHGPVWELVPTPTLPR